MGRPPRRALRILSTSLLLLSAWQLRAQPAVQSGTDRVTYAAQVAPILSAHCVECHRTDGGAPFSLLTYDDARRRARQIADVTASRDMPPWKPVAAHGGPFQGERRLTDQQIQTLARWVELGAEEGSPADLPPLPKSQDWRSGTPDLIVEQPQPYVLSADGPDVFRNFVIPVPASGTGCVKGFEFRPGSRAVHHANIMIDRTRSSRRFDDQDREPGYAGPLVPDAEYPDGHFLGWTPGQAAPFLPDDMCWRLEAGSDFVLQMHLRPTGKPERVQPALALYRSERPATRIPVVLRLGRQDIEISAGDRNYRVRDAYVLPVDAEVRAIQPHAHYLARDLRAFAELPDGSMQWLIHISDWDFNWQDVYRYASPFWLPRGTRIVMEYTYDNSAANPRSPQHPPRRVTWGQSSANEMGDLWLQVLTRSDADRLRLKTEARDKALREDIIGYQTMVRETPRDAAVHESLAKAHLQVGQLDEARRHVEESVRLKPAAAAGHYNLGTVLAAQGRREQAIASFSEAVRLDPTFAYAHNSLGASLYALGRSQEAIGHFRRAIEIEPAYANALNNLARALEGRGELEEAVLRYREALRIQPDNVLTQQNLARALARLAASKPGRF